MTRINFVLRAAESKLPCYQIIFPFHKVLSDQFLLLCNSNRLFVAQLVSKTRKQDLHRARVGENATTYATRNETWKWDRQYTYDSLVVEKQTKHNSEPLLWRFCPTLGIFPPLYTCTGTQSSWPSPPSSIRSLIMGYWVSGRMAILTCGADDLARRGGEWLLFNLRHFRAVAQSSSQARYNKYRLEIFP